MPNTVAVVKSNRNPRATSSMTNRPRVRFDASASLVADVLVMLFGAGCSVFHRC